MTSTESIGQKLQEGIRVYFKYLFIFGSIPLVALAVWQGIVHYKDRQNESAEAELYEWRRKLAQLETKAGGNWLSNTRDSLLQHHKRATEFNEELTQTLEHYLSQMRKLKKFKAAVRAGLEVAHFLNFYGQREKAISILEEMSGERHLPPPLFALLSYSLGVFYMDQGQCPLALKEFKKIIGIKHKVDWIQSEVLIKSAFCYEHLGQMEEAGSHLEKAHLTYLQQGNKIQDSDIFGSGLKALQFKNFFNLKSRLVRHQDPSVKNEKKIDGEREGNKQEGRGIAKPDQSEQQLIEQKNQGVEK